MRIILCSSTRGMGEVGRWRGERLLMMLLARLQRWRRR